MRLPQTPDVLIRCEKLVSCLALWVLNKEIVRSDCIEDVHLIIVRDLFLRDGLTTNALRLIPPLLNISALRIYCVSFRLVFLHFNGIPRCFLVTVPGCKLFVVSVGICNALAVFTYTSH